MIFAPPAEKTKNPAHTYTQIKNLHNDELGLIFLEQDFVLFPKTSDPRDIFS